MVINQSINVLFYVCSHQGDIGQQKTKNKQKKKWWPLQSRYAGLTEEAEEGAEKQRPQHKACVPLVLLADQRQAQEEEDDDLTGRPERTKHNGGFFSMKSHMRQR